MNKIMASERTDRQTMELKYKSRSGAPYLNLEAPEVRAFTRLSTLSPSSPIDEQVMAGVKQFRKELAPRGIMKYLAGGYIHFDTKPGMAKEFEKRLRLDEKKSRELVDYVEKGALDYSEWGGTLAFVEASSLAHYDGLDSDTRAALGECPFVMFNFNRFGPKDGTQLWRRLIDILFDC
jgi:hypothetical protein